MEETRYCALCHCELSADEDYECDGEQLCESCWEEHTTTCDHCGDVIWANDSISDNSTTLCQCCFDDHYRRCEGCGRILHDDDVLWCNELPYCERCYDELENEIEEYSFKPDPIFYGEGTRYFGVELEVDCAGKDDDNAARIKGQANCRCQNI